MTDIFDLAEVVRTEAGEVEPSNYLVVGEAALNSFEFECRCRQIEAIAALKLPMPFTDGDDRLMNPEDFPDGIDTTEQAMAYINAMQAPIIAGFADVIANARALGAV